LIVYRHTVLNTLRYRSPI